MVACDRCVADKRVRYCRPGKRLTRSLGRLVRGLKVERFLAFFFASVCMADDIEVQEFFNERAAMREYCGKERRDVAEVNAYWETKRKYGWVTVAIASVYREAQRKRLN